MNLWIETSFMNRIGVDAVVAVTVYGVLHIRTYVVFVNEKAVVNCDGFCEYVVYMVCMCCTWCVCAAHGVYVVHMVCMWCTW